MYACSTSIGVRVSSSGRLAETAAGLGPSVEVYPPVHVETVPPDLFGASLRHAERKLDLLAELGARVLVCCSSRTTRGLDDDDLTAEQLHTMAGRAEQRGDSGSRTKPRPRDVFVRTRIPGTSSETSTTPLWGCVSTASMC